MRRADRLLQLIQILRRHRQPVTADRIAAELEVSVRTVYRDIVSLQSDRVPVRGEPGIGYVLDDGYDLPPLMFDVDEIEAIMLGLRFVEQRGDDDLVLAAQDVAAKIAAVLPARLKPLLFEAGLLVPPPFERIADLIDVGVIREAIRLRRKLHIAYSDAVGEETERTVWPLALGYLARVQVVVAWCELRGAFRHFRTDRILSLDMGEAYPSRRAALLKEWESGFGDRGAVPRIEP